MKKGTIKKLLALGLTAAMTFGSSFTALADFDVTGDGAVEIDNSEEVTYSSITVPTVATGSTMYNITLDPMGLLAEYNSSTYTSAGSAYFRHTDTAELVDVDKSGKNTGTAQSPVYSGLFEKAYDVAEDAAIDLDALNTAVAGLVTAGTYAGAGSDVVDDPVTAITTIDTTKTYALWVPDTATVANSSATSGLFTGSYGKYLTLDESNILNYFDVKATETNGTASYVTTLKKDYKAGTSVCDGKLYEVTYKAISADFDNYTGVEDDLYTDNQGTAFVKNTDVLTTIPAVIGYGPDSDAIKITNKSTSKITVDAKVKLINYDGLEIDTDGTIAASDKDARLWVKVDGSTAANAVYLQPVLDTDGNVTEVSGTYSVNLDEATKTEIVYQTQNINATLGGHDYARYEAAGTTYVDDSFFVSVGANNKSDDDTKDAWKEYAKNATAAPKLQVIYSVSAYTPATASMTATGSFDISNPDDVVLTLTDATNVSDVTDGTTSLTSGTDYDVAGDFSTVTIKKEYLASVLSAADDTATIEVTADSAEVTGTVLTATITATQSVTYDLTVNAATATADWSDRTADYTIKIDESIVADLTQVDLGLIYNGNTFTYFGNNEFNPGNTTLLTAGVVEVDGNVITVKANASTYLPAGSGKLYVIPTTGRSITITINF